jgi:hypothetical protein
LSFQLDFISEQGEQRAVGKEHRTSAGQAITLSMTTQSLLSQRLFPYNQDVYGEYVIQSVAKLYSEGSGLDKTMSLGKDLPYKAVMKFGKKKFELSVYNINTGKLIWVVMKR